MQRAQGDALRQLDFEGIVSERAGIDVDHTGLPGDVERLLALASAVPMRMMEPEPARLCEVCARVSLMTGAGIMLMTGDTQQGSVCSSNPVSGLIEEFNGRVAPYERIRKAHRVREIPRSSLGKLLRAELQKIVE